MSTLMKFLIFQGGRNGAFFLRFTGKLASFHGFTVFIVNFSETLLAILTFFYL